MSEYDVKWLCWRQHGIQTAATNRQESLWDKYIDTKCFVDNIPLSQDVFFLVSLIFSLSIWYKNRFYIILIFSLLSIWHKNHEMSFFISHLIYTMSLMALGLINGDLGLFIGCDIKNAMWYYLIYSV